MNQLDNMLYRLFGKHSRSSAAMFVGLLCSVVLQIVESSRPVWTGLLVVALSVILFYVQIWLDKRKNQPKNTENQPLIRYEIQTIPIILWFMFFIWDYPSGFLFFAGACLLGIAILCVNDWLKSKNRAASSDDVQKNLENNQ